MRHIYKLGKIDYNGTGRKNCLCTLEWELKDGRFSMSANVWNHIQSDIYMGGQCVEEICGYFPHNKKAQRALAIWREWHLNDMKAGSPAQENWLKANPVSYKYPESHYEKASAALADAGLNPDPNYLHNGQPYKYGSAWLKVELPADIVAEIESWS